MIQVNVGPSSPLGQTLDQYSRGVTPGLYRVRKAWYLSCEFGDDEPAGKRTRFIEIENSTRFSRRYAGRSTESSRRPICAAIINSFAT